MAYVNTNRFCSRQEHGSLDAKAEQLPKSVCIYIYVYMYIRSYIRSLILMVEYEPTPALRLISAPLAGRRSLPVDGLGSGRLRVEGLGFRGLGVIGGLGL